MITKAHKILAEDPETGDELNHVIAYIHRASKESVGAVLIAEEGTHDGRSEWLWIRLSTGDLILGIFPRGDTYIDREEDAQYPGDGS